MNKQFQEDIKLAHSMNKVINRHLSMADISISWIDVRDYLSGLIWNKRRALLEQLKDCDFNIPNPTKK